MAKSITSALIGCAVADGLIMSVKQPITDYIPELRPELKKVTIEHLLQMTSGIKFNESYVNPFGEAAKYYYGTNVRKYIRRLHLEDEPGTQFHYTSGNTQLLGLVLERALRNKTVTEYFQEKIWTPLGMEYDASWSIDREENGLEKTFCCVNARARDYAKIGRLYCNGGNWNGKQLIPADWVNGTCKADTSCGGVSYYHYQWWLLSPADGDFMANGVQGQYIYVNPAKKIVIVRLGRNHGHVKWKTVFRELSNELAIVNSKP
jgi:CubicO group peptidase (beta-lactamase class C family)